MKGFIDIATALHSTTLLNVNHIAGVWPKDTTRCHLLLNVSGSGMVSTLIEVHESYENVERKIKDAVEP